MNEQEARYFEAVAALAKGGFMMDEPGGTPSFPRARKLVIGFEDPDDASDAMLAVGIAIRAHRASLTEIQS